METPRSDGVAVGVNVVNPQRLSPGDREAVLGQLQAAGAHMIRALLSHSRNDSNDYRLAID